MRDIKFRAWDKEEKRFVGCFTEGLRMNFINGQLHNNSGFNVTSHFELIQYTGLKDKNGKEIYEGDIVQYERIKAKVFFGHCGFEFEWIDNYTDRIRGKKHEPMFRNTSIVFEVIGNIYENPELLKEESING